MTQVSNFINQRYLDVSTKSLTLNEFKTNFQHYYAMIDFGLIIDTYCKDIKETSLGNNEYLADLKKYCSSFIHPSSNSEINEKMLTAFLQNMDKDLDVTYKEQHIILKKSVLQDLLALHQRSKVIINEIRLLK